MVSGLVKLVVLTNIFFNNQQQETKIKRLNFSKSAFSVTIRGKEIKRFFKSYFTDQICCK